MELQDFRAEIAEQKLEQRKKLDVVLE